MSRRHEDKRQEESDCEIEVYLDKKRIKEKEQREKMDHAFNHVSVLVLPFHFWQQEEKKEIASQTKTDRINSFGGQVDTFIGPQNS